MEWGLPFGHFFGSCSIPFPQQNIFSPRDKLYCQNKTETQSPLYSYVDFCIDFVIFHQSHIYILFFFSPHGYNIWGFLMSVPASLRELDTYSALLLPKVASSHPALKQNPACPSKSSSLSERNPEYQQGSLSEQEILRMGTNLKFILQFLKDAYILFGFWLGGMNSRSHYLRIKRRKEYVYWLRWLNIWASVGTCMDMYRTPSNRSIDTYKVY